MVRKKIVLDKRSVRAYGLRCHLMARPAREYSSGGIVLKPAGGKIKVLLIKDPYGSWTWPKGKIDKAETPLDAAAREISEETGLKSLREIEKIGRTDYFYTRDKRLIYKTVYLYLFEAMKDELLAIQTSEIMDGRWVDVTAAMAMVSYKGAKQNLQKAVRIYKKQKTA